jgi:hypothetical protein
LKLAHVGPEAIAHLPEAVIEAKIDGRGPTTAEYETCSISKAKQIISRRPTPDATKPYERICWDLIPMTFGYNNVRYLSYLVCDKILMNHVYTQRFKTESP